VSHRRPRRPRPAPAAPPTPPTVAEAREALDELYAQLPTIACRGLCADSCHNVDASQLERDRIAEVHGVVLAEPVPHALWQQMADRARAALGDAATGNGPRGLELPRCPALGPLNTCTVYDVRPFTCRAFGAVHTDPVHPSRGPMMCDHGCVPEGVMTLGEYARIVAQIEQLSRQVTGVARRPGRPREDHP
jgi:Fe-S-cluster containining protein